MEPPFNEAIEYIGQYNRQGYPVAMEAFTDISVDKIGKTLWIAPENADPYAVYNFAIIIRESSTPVYFRARLVSRPNRYNIRIKVVSSRIIIALYKNYTNSELPLRKRAKKIRRLF